jgi:hypothetical protein
VRSSNRAFQPDVQPTRDLITQLQSLNMAASLLLQQPGAAPTGMATPPPPAPGAVSGTAAQIAVKNAQFKANITRENLTTSRKCEYAPTAWPLVNFDSARSIRRRVECAR